MNIEIRSNILTQILSLTVDHSAMVKMTPKFWFVTSLHAGKYKNDKFSVFFLHLNCENTIQVSEQWKPANHKIRQSLNVKMATRFRILTNISVLTTLHLGMLIMAIFELHSNFWVKFWVLTTLNLEQYKICQFSDI